MTDELKAEREAFEKWMKGLDGFPYARQFSNLMWQSWQARAKLDHVSQDAVRDAERYRIIRNYYGVDLDDSDRRVYHDALDRQLDKDISEFGAKAMAAREGGE